MTFFPYRRCTRCSGRAQPGTVNLQVKLIQHFPGTRSMGVYNCRNVAGSAFLSVHSCGRAGDTGVLTNSDGSARTDLGDPIVRFLAEHWEELGIITIIYNRVIYDDASPRGRHYGGVHPHWNHVHWEQTASASITLTNATIEALMVDLEGDDMLGFAIGTVGSPSLPFSDKAAALQLLLNDRGASLTVDGLAGDSTRNALIAFQTAKDIGAPERGSGEVGAFTYAALFRPTSATGVSLTIVQDKIAEHASNPDAHHE